MPEDTSGQDIIHEHLKSILDEAISTTVDLDDYGKELAAYANAVMEGLELHALFVAEGHVVLGGAFSRGAQ